MTIELILSMAIGYILGSVPFALVIGKVFYKKDVRNYGSKNLGGSNTGRVLGRNAGLAVMTLDLLKVTFAIFLVSFMQNKEVTVVAAGISAAIGHCFPLFARFKGGKAVATMYGFLFGMVVVAGYSFWIFLFPLFVFLIVLYLWKIVALASIFSAIANTVFIYFVTGSWSLTMASFAFTVLIVVRHRKNLERMRKHEENKISWM